MQIISLWSGPRNVSTALMYSFAQREDTEVIDEPFYGHYLSEVPVDHPGREEILTHMETDGIRVMEHLLLKGQKPLRFIKNMAHHWIGMENELLRNFTNVFLIRDPAEMLPSLVKQLPAARLNDTALNMQVTLFDKLSSEGHRPVVIDSRLLLLNPRHILSRLCDAMAIPFHENMLSWKPGPRPEDGIWAKYWYHSLHASSGFTEYARKEEPFPEDLIPLLEECKPYYDYLYHKALKNQ